MQTGPAELSLRFSGLLLTLQRWETTVAPGKKEYNSLPSSPYNCVWDNPYNEKVRLRVHHQLNPLTPQPPFFYTPLTP